MIRVLIVEDDPMVAEFNRRYLAQIDGFVLAATAASAADTLLFLEKQEVDLVLLDIFMPQMTGLELLAKIRASDKSVDVIVVSAACDRYSIQKALRYGAVDYLIKPFEFERFNSALAAYRDRAAFMCGRDTIRQAELDRKILLKEQLLTELPKGLCLNTLSAVWNSVRTGAGSSFTAEAMAGQVGISRVSLRKYLKFLMQLELVHMEVAFGAIGRPVYKYRCVNPQSDFLSHF
ncbi:MAG: response regulator [Sporomusaceae bacterium]|nr:response regulator [Sporomusaceae bacterium]